VLLVQCCRDNGPQLSAALSATDNDESSHVNALGLLAVIIEHVVFELTDIMVRLYMYTPSHVVFELTDIMVRLYMYTVTRPPLCLLSYSSLVLST